MLAGIERRAMLTIERLYDKNDGRLMAGFFIRNRQRKCIAIGALPATSKGFLVITHGRYEHDADLVAKCERLTGLTARHRERSAVP